MESKEYSWAWVTADRLLSHGPCDLVYAQAVSDGGEIKDTWLYDGENTSGDKIINLQKGTGGNITLSPKVPVYCRRGLYVDVGDNTEGVLVQWRELPRRAEPEKPPPSG
jgi:hypothetical protein